MVKTTSVLRYKKKTMLSELNSPKTLDVSNGADFCKTRGSSFDMASKAFDNLTWQVKLKSLISWCLFVGWETILQIDVVFVSTLYTGCCLLLLCCFSSFFCVVWTVVILCCFCCFVLLLGCRYLFWNLATRSRRSPVCTGFPTSLMQFLFSTGLIGWR